MARHHRQLIHQKNDVGGDDEPIKEGGRGNKSLMWDWSFDGKVVSEHIILIFSRSTGVLYIYNISTGYTTSDAQRETTLTRSWLWPCETTIWKRLVFFGLGNHNGVLPHPP